MRLVTLKIRQAFAELDPFTDEQCRVYIREAKRRRRGKGIVWGVGGFVVGGVFTVILTSVHLLLMYALDNYLYQGDAPDWLVWVSVIIQMVVFFGTIPICILIARDMWLRRAVRVRLDTARCLCGYSLLGLVPAGDPDGGGAMVVCPECGLPTLLQSAGLSGDDLMMVQGSPDAVRAVRQQDELTRRLMLAGVEPGREEAAKKLVENTAAMRTRTVGWVLIGVGLLVGVSLAIALFSSLFFPVVWVREWVVPLYFHAIGWFVVAFVAYVLGLIASKITRKSLLTRAIRRAVKA